MSAAAENVNGKVHVDVIPPGSLDATRMEFSEELTVEQAAVEAARRLNRQASSPGFKNADREQLPGNQTLREAGVNDDYVLFLIDTAGGQ